MTNDTRICGMHKIAGSDNGGTSAKRYFQNKHFSIVECSNQVIQASNTKLFFAIKNKPGYISVGDLANEAGASLIPYL